MSEKKVAVIGSARGIGKEIAKRLASDSFRIVLNDINEAELRETEEEFKNNQIEVTAFVGDVTKPEDQENLVKHAVDTFGSVNVFINNAGVEGQVGPLIEADPKQVDFVLNVNIKASYTESPLLQNR